MDRSYPNRCKCGRISNNGFLCTNCQASMITIEDHYEQDNDTEDLEMDLLEQFNLLKFESEDSD